MCGLETRNNSPTAWNFDVERVDVMFGHNVEYTGSMSRLPILVLQWSATGAAVYHSTCD